MDRNKIPHDPRHLWVPSGAFKMISKPMVCSVQTVHLSCVKINTISKRTETRFLLSQITSEYHWVHQKWFLSLWYFGENRAPILHLHKHSLQMNRNEITHDPRHQVVPSGAFKTIFEPMVCLAQTMHLSCVKSNTISKRTETSFHLNLITKVYHRVHPKRFLSLWYFGANRAPTLHRY
jgi:hypothetical protein